MLALLEVGWKCSEIGAIILLGLDCQQLDIGFGMDESLPCTPEWARSPSPPPPTFPDPPAATTLPPSGPYLSLMAKLWPCNQMQGGIPSNRAHFSDN